MLGTECGCGASELQGIRLRLKAILRVQGRAAQGNEGNIYVSAPQPCLCASTMPQLCLRHLLLPLVNAIPSVPQPTHEAYEVAANDPVSVTD